MGRRWGAGHDVAEGVTILEDCHADQTRVQGDAKADTERAFQPVLHPGRGTREVRAA